MTSADCGFCYLPVGNWAQNGSCLPLSRNESLMSAVGRCADPRLMQTRGLRFVHGHCPTNYGFMAVLGLVLYLISFAPGLGPMPWTINSEIYPLWARSAGSAAATTVNWTSNLLISMTFLTLTEVITKSGRWRIVERLDFDPSATIAPETTRHFDALVS